MVAMLLCPRSSRIRRNGTTAIASQLAKVRRSEWSVIGKRIADVGDPVDLDSPPALSPDGTRIALPLFDAASINLWMLDLARGIGKRLPGNRRLGPLVRRR